MIVDMTKGKPTGILWRFAMSLLLSVAFQQLYSIVDSIVAGNFINKDALAAVGASYPITMIFIAFATGSNIGCSVVISQLFGAKKYSRMKTAIYTSLIAVAALAVILTIAGVLCCNPLISALSTPDNIFADSAEYLRIYIFGLLFLFIYNIATGIFTALGDSKTPLYFLIFSSLLNIALDLIFVIVFNMGVAGVAWATFAAQGVSSILAFIWLIRRIAGIETDKEEKVRLFDGNILGKISMIAIPSILQQSFISVGNLFVQGLINGYGSDVVAGYSAAIKLNTFAITIFTTLGNALSSFTAQNIGAGKIERVGKGFKSTMIMGFVVCIPFILCYTLFGKMAIELFLDTGASDIESALKVGREFLLYVSPFYIVILCKLISDAVLRGSGSMKQFMIATFSDLIIRVILAYVFAKGFGLGYTGIWFSWPVGWFFGTALSLLFYYNKSWMKESIAAK